ncbi:aquaporin [Cellulomonas sp. SG140]|uniref:aquaporin n=1 Tax=Cellulomonas sp. SG140 TaxID=2976536 RepID=UPI0021E849BD|nr:aquaporin [Cellulomonas sp. SG140]
MSQQKPDPADITAATASDVPVETEAVPAGTRPEAVSEPEELADVTAEGELVLDEDVETYVEGPSLAAKLGVEALGTFVLVFAGVGVALYSAFSGVGGTLAVALAFGIAVLAGIIAFGRVSGGHFNPAVTLGAAVAGRARWADVLPYWLAQVVGGALGAAVLFLTVPSGLPQILGHQSGGVRALFSTVSTGYGTHSPLAHVLAQNQITSDVTFGVGAALLAEAVGTAIFVAVILGATDRRANLQHVPFAVGLTLSAVILVLLPITNASVNPARSLATAIFSESWALKQVWLFWVAPLLGAAVSGLLYRAFAREPVEDDLFGEEEAEVVVVP